VAKPLPQAHGLRGKKGVLWWEIHRLLALTRPKMVFLENVDRLLKSPAIRRGRDFAVILSCLTHLDYDVEWRVINAADYGAPQRRRRVFIVAYRTRAFRKGAAEQRLLDTGVLARAFPAKAQLELRLDEISVEAEPYPTSSGFNRSGGPSPFRNAGVCIRGRVTTAKVEPLHDGPCALLGDVLVPSDEVPDRYYIPAADITKWERLKKAKAERRVHKGTGLVYHYTEGSLPFPDPLDRPARTILTGEGGTGPSRFKHVVDAGDGRMRRLTPVELERLNGFPDGWTETGMSDNRRAFCMGNALVVDMVERVGYALANPAWRVSRVEAQTARSDRIAVG
jgi:DNA (cytosine-5)-methyltransferase 1